MTRTDFQELADLRLKEAEALLNAGCWDGAYYLAGYAVECGLKACIARLTKAEEFPDKDRVQKSWSHRVEELLNVAGLKSLRDADSTADPTLSANWATVEKWREDARYKRWSEAQARGLVDAVGDPTQGVLRWIRMNW